MEARDLNSPSPAEKPAELPNVVLDEQEANFLAARLRRLLAHFGYHLPDFAKDDGSLIRIAGSCIGGLLTTLNASEKPAEGEPGGVALPRPVSHEEVLAALQRAGLLVTKTSLEDMECALNGLLADRAPSLDAPGEGQRCGEK